MFKAFLRECALAVQLASSIIEFVRIYSLDITRLVMPKGPRSVCDFASLCNDTLRYLWGVCAGLCTSTMCVRIHCVFGCKNISTAFELVERAPQKRMAKWGLGRVRDWQCDRYSALSFCASRKVY